MIVTVFRTRLKPGLREEYVALANHMNELARTMPGYISHKDFYANDGERVAISSSRMRRDSAPGAPIPSIAPPRKWRGKSTIRNTIFWFARSIASRSSRRPTRPRHRLDRSPLSPH
jgi:hypothetical protein